LFRQCILPEDLEEVQAKNQVAAVGFELTTKGLLIPYVEKEELGLASGSVKNLSVPLDTISCKKTLHSYMSSISGWLRV
jgi:hypothetical protein